MPEDPDARPTPGAVLDVIATSAATGEGLDDLATAIFRHVVRDEPEVEPAATPATHRVYRPGRADAFRIDRTPRAHTG